MTFLHFLAAVLFLYVADEQNHSQLHFGKKCFQNENGDIILKTEEYEIKLGFFEIDKANIDSDWAIKNSKM